MGGKSTLRTRQKGKKAPTLAGLKKKAWKLLSEVVRREYAGMPTGDWMYCYTCGGVHHWKDIHAAHAIPGRTGTTLLDEEIIRPCCYRCNVGLHGNYQVFVPKLIMEHTKNDGITDGMAWWEAKLQASRQIKKWSRSELQEKIDNYKARLNGL